MAKITSINCFTSPNDLKEQYGVMLPKPHEWRLLPLAVSGAIHGIPTSQGVAVATNGIHVAIVQHTRLFIGHIDFFVADEQEVVVNFKKNTVTTKQERKPTVDISEFI